MMLLVDVGNSRLKWSTSEYRDQDLRVNSIATSGLDEALLDKQWRPLPVPDRILLSNVGAADRADIIDNWCRQHWDRAPVHARVSREFMGVRCAYPDTGQLGVDRWLAVIAGWLRYRQACFIVDCGTATTIDGIDPDGRHQGGLILPGLEMMQRGLIHGTQGINSRSSQTGLQFADNTAVAVTNGCLLAAVAGIDRAARIFNDSCAGRAYRGLITGGAAKMLLPYLEHEYEVDEALVLDGLRWMASES